MSIAILSASQYSGSGDACASLRAACALKEELERRDGARPVRIFDLRHYGVASCVMCADCAVQPRCSRDAPFNDLLDGLRGFDDLALVVPHYAGVPSRLAVVMEKLQEMFWLRYCRSADTREVLAAARVGIIVHGGQVEGFEEQYRQNLLAPLTAAWRGLGLRVLNDRAPAPVCFGVLGYEEQSGQQFPASRHDPAAVRAAAATLAALYDAD